ncbi:MULTISPECIES: crotonase/enoyl-CoA hydratase family protein [Actinomadura]|uniref:Crotonase/enoyl-CoA hydratase family protein n=1 Tax=Actinomadura yumaensis TaxID=111807 RepID=A0ABW2CDF2_9ACTN|nr:crotonase/enoyl-CoA hydratase family protein [Actinomadura sp. J1-007]MWK33397.1 crotonase/enoyl-CoA hydratase family protein [Actinomadura sp. J1-007]
MPVRTEREGPVHVVTIDRPERRNAVDGPMARALGDAFAAFESDPEAKVAVLTGAGGTFCAGNDLKAMAAGDFPVPTETAPPMNVTRTALGKPVIAAVEGYCFGGGFELALWCDLRVASATAEFGALNLRRGLPCMDSGTVRLPRLVGHARALDILLTARRVPAAEAERIGLVTRLTAEGEALPAALELAREIAETPQEALRAARRSVIEQWSLSDRDAAANETRHAEAVLPAF